MRLGAVGGAASGARAGPGALSLADEVAGRLSVVDDAAGGLSKAAGGAGSVALDTNALIAAVERGQGAAVLGGRTPIVPLTACAGL